MSNCRSQSPAKFNASILCCCCLAISGCSLVGTNSAPDPAADNVRCILEYQPSVSPNGNDLLFLAVSSPYDSSEFNLSLPDVLLHGMFAPGRHLIADLRVEGATCSTRPWKKGFRLPATASDTKVMSCRRIGVEAVLFEVETKWGVCTQRISRGDTNPRDLGVRRDHGDLSELGGTT